MPSRLDLTEAQRAVRERGERFAEGEALGQAASEAGGGSRAERASGAKPPQA